MPVFKVGQFYVSSGFFFCPFRQKLRSENNSAFWKNSGRFSKTQLIFSPKLRFSDFYEDSSTKKEAILLGNFSLECAEALFEVI